MCKCSDCKRSNPIPLGEKIGEPRIYRIIRFRFEGRPRTVRNNVTLTEAQTHCEDPETSSRTCSARTARRRPGTWFDGYDYMRGCRPREGR